MKFVHISDLHLGKKLHGYDMIEEQEDALSQVSEFVRKNDIQKVVIAGDVYDTPRPPQEAIRVLDRFLTGLSEDGVEVMMISGNHDSLDQLSFGKDMLKKAGVHVAGRYDGKDCAMEGEDEYGKYVFHLVPFVRPRDVRPYGPADDYSQAFNTVVDHMNLDPDKRHILVAHQFFGGEKTGSEENIGNLDRVDCQRLRNFDYCALGHLHRPQKVDDDCALYSGTLLKYSASEAGQDKYFNVVEVGDKNTGVKVEKIPVKPKRDLVRIEGNLKDLLDKNFSGKLSREDYYDIVLDDSREIPGAYDELEEVYPRILRMTWNCLNLNNTTAGSEVLLKSDEELIEEYFKARSGKDEMSDYQKEILESLWNEVKEDEAA